MAAAVRAPEALKLGALSPPMGGFRRRVVSRHCNGLVLQYAEQGEVEEAEHWMRKLDSARGLPPTIAAFNGLLLAVGKQGNLEKADAWFVKAESALHPEFGDLQPTAQSFDAMVQIAAAANDVARTDRYLSDMRDLGHRPDRRTFFAAIAACLRAEQPKRAHLWLQACVQGGCSQCRSYPPEEVRRVRGLIRSMQLWCPEDLVAQVLSVAEGLAAAGNTVTADEWLGYLVQCGVPIAHYPASWEHIRAASPPRIVPARLHADTGEPPAPLRLLPAALSGERRQAGAIASGQESSRRKPGSAAWALKSLANTRERLATAAAATAALRAASCDQGAVRPRSDVDGTAWTRGCRRTALGGRTPPWAHPVGPVGPHW